MKKYLFIILIALTSSCKKDASDPQFQFTGTVTKQSYSVFQYGSHLISNSNVQYQLLSKDINLDLYINKYVTVYGTLKEGQPIEGGPSCIDVTNVKE